MRQAFCRIFGYRIVQTEYHGSPGTPNLIFINDSWISSECFRFYPFSDPARFRPTDPRGGFRLV